MITYYIIIHKCIKSQFLCISCDITHILLMGRELNSSATESKGRMVCRLGLLRPQASLANTLEKADSNLSPLQSQVVAWGGGQKTAFNASFHID